MKIKLLIILFVLVGIVGCSAISNKCFENNNIYLIATGGRDVVTTMGYTDRFGKMLIPAKYEEARQFSEGLAAVKLNRKWGFIDKNDSIIIPFIYGWASSFGEYGFKGLSIVKVDNVPERAIGMTSLGKTGLINKAGELVIPMSYVFISPIVNGFALINNGSGIREETHRYNGKYGFINRKGKVVIPCIYEDAEPFSYKISLVKRAGKWGGINSRGKEIVPCVFDTLYRDKTEHDVIIGKKGLNSVRIDSKGKIIQRE